MIEKSANQRFLDRLLSKKEEDETLELEKDAGEEIMPPSPEDPTVAPPAPSIPKSLTSRSVFSHPEAHPVALDVVLLKHFQLDWLSWLPETLFPEIQNTFNTSIAEVNKIKILAIQTLHVIDAFWEEWEVFEKTIWALNGMIPRVDAVQPPDLPMLFAGIDSVNHIAQNKFGEEIARYTAAVFLHEGVIYAPPPFDFCQIYICQPYYICNACNKKGDAFPPFDGLCSSCAGHFDSEHPFKFKPDQAALNKGHGRDIKILKTFDELPVKQRFEVLDKMSPEQLAKNITENAPDIQSAKLIGAIDYKKYRAKQLSDQLTSLREWLES